jgi:ATP-dependent RNA helicase DeaD
VAAEAELEGDFAEIYVNVGRRDGARAADFQQILTERAGLARAHVRRIRVRERNAFVSVRREDLARALAALGGATIAGKLAMAEQARDRAEGTGEGAVSPEGSPAPSPQAASEAAGDEAVPTPPIAAMTHGEASAQPSAEVGGAPTTQNASVEEPAEEAVPTGRSMS